MHIVREPLLKPTAIRDLKPTQITVGMREVEAKRVRWRRESEGKAHEGEERAQHGISKRRVHRSEDRRGINHRDTEGTEKDTRQRGDPNY